MTTLVFPAALESAALVAMLRTTLAGHRVYLSGDVYDTPPPDVYVELHRVSGEPWGGSLGDAAGDCYRSVWQVDTPGRRQDQAELLMGLVCARWLTSNGAGGFAFPVPLDGWGCAWRAQVADMGTSPEGQPRRKVFVPRRRFEIRWVPQ